MNRIKIQAIAFLATIVLFTAVACKKEKTECSTCTTSKPDAVATIVVGEPIAATSFDMPIWDVFDNHKQEIAIARDQNSALISACKSFLLSNNLEPQPNDVAFVLYTNDLLSQTKKVTASSLQGISEFHMIGSTLFHRMYKLENNRLTLINELTASTPNISYTTINKITKKLYAINGVSSSVVVLDGKAMNKTAFAKCADIFAYRLNAYFGNNTYSTSSKVAAADDDFGGGDKCGKPCTAKTDGTCLAARFEYAPATCDKGKGLCARNRSVNFVATNGLLPNSAIANVPSVMSLYSLRDNLLSTSSFGQKYINYYYSLSSVDNLCGTNAAIALQSVQLLINYKYVIDNMMDPMVSGSTIIISPAAQADIIAYLNTLIANSNSNADIVILNDIINDVNAIAGLSKSQILNTYF
ncbi:MAG: hypothetical protein RL660_2352 [Bacteroidota bacterium]|jgi:hypothetical protein